MHFFLGVSALYIPGCSYLSLPPLISGQSLPGDVSVRLPEYAANLAPLSFTDLCGLWFLTCCLLHVFVTYFLWPLDMDKFATDCC